MEKFKNIPITEWNKMLLAIEKLSQASEHGEMLNEDQAATLLSIKKATLDNYRYNGTIPENCFCKTVTGSYVYFKNKLCNL